MKKTYSLGVELRALRTICESEGRASQELLAKLDETHFATEVGRASFKRIIYRLRKNGIVPDWGDLSSDPGLDQSIKDVLENAEVEPVVTKKRTTRLIHRMNEYQKLRTLLDIGSYLEKQFKSPNPIDPDDITQAIQSRLQGMSHGRAFKVMRIGGDKSNVDKYLERVLQGKAARYIPTGFKGFDDINRGVPTGSVFIVAGPTGSGKSLLLGQLSNNMAMNGARIGFFQLEMFNEESLQRDVARVGQIDMTKLLDPLNRLTNKERKELRERYLEYDRKIAKRGGAIDFFEFEEDVTIEMLLSTAKPYGYDVLAIDYLGLLEGMSGEDQWRAMSNAVRVCHHWSKQNDCVVILAAQLSEEGQLRYAKGMAEHAKLMWQWKHTQMSRDTGVYEIEQPKARQLSNHNFLLFFNKPQMTVTDADASHVKAYNDNQRKGGGDGKKREGGSSWKSDKSLSWGESSADDDIPEPVPGKDAKQKYRPPKEAFKGRGGNSNRKGPRDIAV